jgi:hypothetical protein
MLKIKKRIHIASLLFFLSITCYILPTVCNAYISFERTYGGSEWDWAFSVQQTVPDGGYIIAGLTESFSFSNSDAYLVKTDSLGDTLWTNHYGFPGVWNCSQIRCVQQTFPDGGYILAGTTTDSCEFGDDDIYLIKTDPLGNELWTKIYGDTADDFGFSVQQTQDGGYIIVGYTESFGAGSRDVWLLKTDPLGDTLWTKTYGGVNSDVGYSIQETQNGGFIIAGATDIKPPTGAWDVWLLKTDSLGDTLWTKTFGGSIRDDGYSVQQTSDGGFIIAGSTLPLGAPWFDVYLLKTDSLGDTLWTKTYGDTFDEESFSVQQTQDGGFIIAGWKIFSFGTDPKDLYLLKTDALGDTLWTRTYDYDGTNSKTDEGWSVELTSDGGFIIAGQTCGGKPGCEYDFYLVKPDIWGPEILSACASDGSIPAPGIDDDDYVLITFGEVIDSVLALSEGHIWSDGLGFIESAVWNATGDQLTINLSTSGGLPTVEVGDTIYPDGVTITDLNKWGNPCVSPVVITCSFGPVGIEEGKDNDKLKMIIPILSIASQ